MTLLPYVVNRIRVDKANLNPEEGTLLLHCTLLDAEEMLALRVSALEYQYVSVDIRIVVGEEGSDAT